MSFISYVGAATIGGTITAALSLGQKQWDKISEARSLAAIINAEIAATLSMIDQRGYVRSFSANLKVLKEGKEVPFNNFIHERDRLDEAYRQALQSSKLGLLGPELSALVVKFYRQLNGLIGDIVKYGGAEENGKPVARSMKIALLESAILIWGQAEVDAQSACLGLTAFAKRSVACHMALAFFGFMRWPSRARQRQC